MARRKSAPKKPIVTQELSSILFGWLIAFFVVCLIFIDPSSTLGSLLMRSGMFLYGESYLFVQLSILLPLAVFLMSAKLRWNIERLVGIVLYLLAFPTLLGIVSDWSDGAKLNFSAEIIEIFGKVPGFVLMLALIFVSLYLSLRISYRHIIQRVSTSASIGASVSREGVSRMRDIIIGDRDRDEMTDEREEQKSVKKSKSSPTTQSLDEEDVQMSTDDIRSKQTKKQSFIESRLREIQAQLSGDTQDDEDTRSTREQEESDLSPKVSTKRNIRVVVQEKGETSKAKPLS